MKRSKIFGISAILLLVGTISTITMTNKQPQTLQEASTKVQQPTPIPNTTQQSEAVPAAPQAVTSDSTTSTVHAAQPVVIQPTPDENKAKVEALIETTAINRGLNSAQADSQWICLDKVISNNIGYNSYDDAIDPVKSPLVDDFLNGVINSDGTKLYIKFDGGGSCIKSYYPA